MGTKTTNIFDPQSKFRFDQAQGGLLDFMNMWSDPRTAFNNSFIQAALAEQMGFINAQGTAANQNYFNNLMAGGGIPGGTATDQATSSELAKNRRFTSKMKSDAQRGLLLGAIDRSSQNVLGAGSLIRPLQTGTKTKTTGFLDNLQKIVGMAMPFITGAAGGGGQMAGITGPPVPNIMGPVIGGGGNIPPPPGFGG